MSIPLPQSAAHDPVFSVATATARGYRPLTNTYSLEERWMLKNALADLRRGRRDYILVAEIPHLPVHLAIYIRASGSEERQ